MEYEDRLEYLLSNSVNNRVEVLDDVLISSSSFLSSLSSKAFAALKNYLLNSKRMKEKENERMIEKESEKVRVKKDKEVITQVNNNSILDNVIYLDDVVVSSSVSVSYSEYVVVVVNISNVMKLKSKTVVVDVPNSNNKLFIDQMLFHTSGVIAEKDFQIEPSILTKLKCKNMDVVDQCFVKHIVDDSHKLCVDVSEVDIVYKMVESECVTNDVINKEYTNNMATCVCKYDNSVCNYDMVTKIQYLVLLANMSLSDGDSKFNFSSSYSTSGSKSQHLVDFSFFFFLLICVGLSVFADGVCSLLCADFGVLVTSLCCFSSVGIG
jgi:hypothetical protein